MATNVKTEGDPLASRFVDIDALPWVDAGPGNEMKVLMHDPETGMLTILSRLAPGASIPFHMHEAMEQTYVLEGSLKDDEETQAAETIRASGGEIVELTPAERQPFMDAVAPIYDEARTQFAPEMLELVGL